MDQPTSLHDEAKETVLLVGVQVRDMRAWEVHDSLNELAQLAGTAGGEVREHYVCRQRELNAGHFIGTGKAAEIADRVAELKVKTVVFDDDLTPAQGRNLEKIMGVKVIDRTQIILDIFAQHAKTREGQLQIELAQMQYTLPRLRRMWTHLERQKGGIGLRGPGEQQIEVDRRRILEKITRIKRELSQVSTRRAEQRKGRRRHGWALISLVGYTNAGKSTLLNRLTLSDVLAYDKLFATLDPTTRQLELPNNQSVLLTDTVGFIRKLPHGLVEAFKATLEEVSEADLLVHVVDVSHPQADAQVEAVLGVLQELHAQEKPVLTVLNKIDRPEAAGQVSRLARRFDRSVAVSAATGEGIDDFCHTVADCLRFRNQIVSLRIPLAEGKIIAQLHSGANILDEKYNGAYVAIRAGIPARMMGACRPFILESCES